MSWSKKNIGDATWTKDDVQYAITTEDGFCITTESLEVLGVEYNVDATWNKASVNNITWNKV